MRYPPGLSVLIAAQNEEAIVEASVASFLPVADEIILVTNGSGDRTPEIARDLAARHAKIQYYDVPELPDLHHNRQYALTKSRYRWILRGDADFVCRPEITEFVEGLRKRKPGPRPLAFEITPVNLSGDLWHTGWENPAVTASRYKTRFTPAPPPITSGTVRVMQRTRFFRFQRRGRWESMRFRRLFAVQKWPVPLWFHCTLDSDRTLFYRSERTNWREQGDFARYPTLDDYVRDVACPRYGVASVEEAMKIYLEELYYPSLCRYEESTCYPYPPILREKMVRDPVYKVVYENGRPAGRVKVPSP